MSIDATQVRVAITGRLLAAPVGTALPADVTTPWSADWIDLGYLTDDGPVMSPKRTHVDVKAWQALDPIRTIVTERVVEWKFKLLQRNAETMRLAYGGGTIVTTGIAPNQLTVYTPPDEADIDDRAFGLEITDGTITDRYVLSRGVVTDLADVVFKRAEASRYECTVKALSAATLWQAISNDPAWVEASYSPMPTPPELRLVTPAHGAAAGATAVTLSGTGLTGTTGVAFGADAATSVVVVSDTHVTCVTPAHAAGPVIVTVTTPLGSDGVPGLFTYDA
jgi:hypothetical protein